MTDTTRAEPMPASDVSAPFWEASREQRFVLQWCDDCDRTVHFPRELCPRCLGDHLSWRPASGRGTVYACSTMHQAGNPTMEGRVPYVVALIDLEEGARMMSNVIGCPPDAVHVGQAVELTWEPLSDGRHLPLFTPAP